MKWDKDFKEVNSREVNEIYCFECCDLLYGNIIHKNEGYGKIVYCYALVRTFILKSSLYSTRLTDLEDGV